MGAIRPFRRPAVVVVLLATCFLGRFPAGSRELESDASETSRGYLFADDFTATRLDESKWNRCHWWGTTGCTISSNDEAEWYLPGQVEQGDGSLHLTASDNPVDAPNGKRYAYRSGMVTTGPINDHGTPSKFAFRYGRVEARVWIPSGAGLWSALWLLPASTESDPEIDIFELRGSSPNDVSMHLHAVGANGRSRSFGEHSLGADLSRGWHTFALDWKPRSLRWFIDGSLAWSVLGSDVPSEPMYLVANLAVGGEYPGPPTATTHFPSTYSIDYIRVRADRS